MKRPDLDRPRRKPGVSGRALLGPLAALGSVVAAAVLAGVLASSPRRGPEGLWAKGRPLLLYCAAGLQPPVEAIARQYEQEFGVPVQIQYGGSGTLLSNIRITRAGDLFLAADSSYIRSANELGLVTDSIPLAQQRPVIVVRQGNPKGIRALHDLLRADTRFALANPDAASIGRTVRALLKQTAQWTQFEQRTTVFTPTVNEVANDVKLGSVDAGIVWDATAAQYPELEPVRVPLFDAAPETISIGLLAGSTQPASALRFARYLGARNKGLKQFEKAHYVTLKGEDWAERPEH